jgi:hydrogenase maturation protease
MTGRTLVVGMGNPDCGDDGVGPLVAEALAARLPPHVETLVRRGDALALLEDWAGAETVILVDAAAAIGEPGRIHRIEPAVAPLPAGLSPGSTHAFSVADAIALARRLGRLPSRLVIYAVEGCHFDPGAPMTPAVTAAAGEVVSLVTRELEIISRAVAPGAGRMR